MSRNPQKHYHRIFLDTIRNNPGCTRQDLIKAGVSPSSCNVLIGIYEMELIRVERSGKTRRITGIWMLEDAA